MSHKVSDEVWAHASTRVRTTPLVVLLRMADAANDDRMMWESMGTIAKRTGLTDRAVRLAVRELEALCVVESIPKDQAPAEASKYRSYVRRIRPVEDWRFTDLEDDTPESGSALNPESGSALNPERGSVTGGNPEPGSPNPKYLTSSSREIETTSLFPPRRPARSEPEEAEETPRPGAKGWDAVRPLRGPGGRKKSRKQQAEEAALAEMELDPAYIVSQALASGYPGEVTEAAVAAEQASLAPPVHRSPAKRSKRPSEELASFFERRSKEVGHPVPGTVNLGALSKNFGRWMREGTDRETIRRMIITYWSASWQRSENVVAWRDFLAQRGLLTGRQAKVDKVNTMESHRYDEEYWSM